MKEDLAPDHVREIDEDNLSSEEIAAMLDTVRRRFEEKRRWLEQHPPTTRQRIMNWIGMRWPRHFSHWMY